VPLGDSTELYHPDNLPQVNGQTLQRGSDNFWAWNPGQPIDPTAPLDLEVAGSNRQVLRARVPSLLNADLGVQFSAS
jgi:hypothetical protein